MNTAALSQVFGRWSSPGHFLISKSVIVALAYLASAELAFLIGTLSDKVFAPFWPPNIVLLCALIHTPSRDWWIYILAVFPAHAIAELGVGMPTAQWLVAFATNCSVAIVEVVLMRMLARGPPWFGGLRNALLYMFATALISPALVALGGAFVPILGGGDARNYWSFWLQWYLANALSGLTLGPLALMALSRETSFAILSNRQRIEGAALALSLTIVCVLAFSISAGQTFSADIPAVLLLPLPLVIWSAIRFGATGASAAILVTTVVAIQQTLNGASPFIAVNSEVTVLGLQMFLIVLAVPVLLLGASTEETRDAIRSAHTNQELMALSAVAADSCLWQYDRKSERFWMTENGRTMFGLNANDPLTRVSIEGRVHPEDRQVAVDAMRAASSADRQADTDFRIIRPGGELRWIRARGRGRKDTQGVAATLSGTFTDITERKAAEREAAARQSEIAHLMRVSMLGELSGGIAHELTQPLTAILSNAQAARVLMGSKQPNLDEISEVLDDIISDDNRAGEVVHRMRALLKRSESKFETVDLNDIVGSTMQLLHSELINRRVRFSCALDDALPLVFGDRIQLQQVLLNLVMNAIDSMNDQAPSRRMIVISTRSLNERDIEISVGDRGTGLSPAHEARVFQPFFSTKERGLGLGLSICSSIVKAHGGKLSLANSPTGGATATFTLPRHS